MGQVYLEPGLKVVFNGEPAEIVRCLSKERFEVLVYSNKKLAISLIDQIKIIPTESQRSESLSDARDLLVDELKHEELCIAERRSSVIVRFLSKEPDLDSKKAAQELGISVSLFYGLVKRYDESTGCLSILRSKRGRKEGSSILDQRTELYIKTAIESAFKGEGANYSKVYSELKGLCCEAGIATPSLGSMIKRIKLLPIREQYKRKYGSEAAKQKFGAKPGKAEFDRPLQQVQMDHTLVDIILCDNIDRRPLARPYVTMLIDVYTRVVLGYYLAFHCPSALSVSAALTHSCFPKRKSLEKLGLGSIDYPFYGVPETLHMDNAREFKSLKFQSACNMHNIKPIWRPYGRKHYGGHVERIIGTFMGMVHFLPGTTMSNIIQKGDYDSEKKSALTFTEFSIWFARQVAIYHAEKHRSLGCSPSEMWQKYYNNGEDTIHYPPVISNSHEFRLDFMPEERRVIRPTGIHLFNMTYWSPVLASHVMTGKVNIKYNPLSLSKIWVKLNGCYTEIHFSNITQCDQTYSEYFYKKTYNRSAQVLVDKVVVELRQENKKLVKTSIGLTKKAKKMAAAKEAYFETVEITSDSWHKNAEHSLAQNAPNYAEMPQPFISED